MAWEVLQGDVRDKLGRQSSNCGKLRKKEWEVRPVPIKEAREIIREHHYAKGTSNTAVATHGLHKKGEWFGGECYGVTWWMPPIVGAAKASWHDPKEVLTLSRMVIKPCAPKNAATFLLMRSVKLLPKKWVCLITYADTWQGHTGGIYRAAGWEYIGETKPSPVYMVDGVMKSKKSSKTNFSRKEMIANGAEYLGSYKKHKFRMVRDIKSRGGGESVNFQQTIFSI